MNEFTENTAHDASEKPDRPERFVDLATARRMLPLLRRVIADVLEQSRRLAELHPEQERLERQRRTLAWPERQRRYQIQEEIRSTEQALEQSTTELDTLGVALLDRVTGRVGIPTVVNEQRAFFSWRLGEEGVHYWHFAGETVRRMIPSTWLKAADLSVLGKS